MDTFPASLRPPFESPTSEGVLHEKTQYGEDDTSRNVRLVAHALRARLRVQPGRSDLGAGLPPGLGRARRGRLSPDKRAGRREQVGLLGRYPS